MKSISVALTARFAGVQVLACAMIVCGSLSGCAEGAHRSKSAALDDGYAAIKRSTHDAAHARLLKVVRAPDGDNYCGYVDFPGSRGPAVFVVDVTDPNHIGALSAAVPRDVGEDALINYARIAETIRTTCARVGAPLV